MRTHEIKLYKFDELREEAKQNTIENWRNSNIEMFWQYEWEESLNKFCNMFPIKWQSWDIYKGINYSFQGEDNIRELTGLRLRKYIINNYWNDIFKGKYYGKLVDCPVDKKHPVGKEHIKRYSKCQFEYDCPLTGFGGDMDILEPILEFLNKPNDTDLETLLYDCLQNWLIAVKNDYETQQSDEYISEHLEINEYEFTEDGKRF